MGILNPLVCDDIDMYASEMLRAEDPEPMDGLAAMFGGGSSNDDDDAVIVNGVRY